MLLLGALKEFKGCMHRSTRAGGASKQAVSEILSDEAAIRRCDEATRV